MINPNISKVDRRFLLALRVTFHSILDSISIGCRVILCKFDVCSQSVVHTVTPCLRCYLKVQLGAGIMVQFTWNTRPMCSRCILLQCTI